MRSGYRTVVTWPQRGEGERAAYNLARVKASWLGEGDPAAIENPLRFAQVNLRDGFIAAGLKLAVLPSHRLFRRRAERSAGIATSPVGVVQTGRAALVRRPAHRRHRRPRGPRPRPLRRLRDEDRRGRHARLPLPRVPGRRPRLRPERAAREDQPLRRRRRRAPAAEQARRQELGPPEGARPPRRPGARRRAAEPLRRAPPAHGPRVPAGLRLAARVRGGLPYNETADQRDAIELVKPDMESERPMDRLICGDVGFGKTEVALRAAFKAADAGRQVLMLVPTTILAQQHFGTFTERLKDYPFTIEHVSRFRPAAEQKQGDRGLPDGRRRHPHRHPPDPEPRRPREGPRPHHRRRGAALRRQAEGAAAPAQAPRRRHLDERDADPAHAADVARRAARHLGHQHPARGPAAGEDVRRRVRRGARQAGARARARARRAGVLPPQPRRDDRRDGRAPARPVPGDALRGRPRPDGGHELEDRMLRFLRGEADVLVCTSIIESGIDIPQANTLVVDRADVFGLSQLYQIRGRVGRSRERAYAYLLYPSAAALTPEAAHRLAALSDYTELGAGFKIAMRDLELRGAGNLLGDEQSGHVAALGFELYMQMLDEAVAAAERPMAARRRGPRARAPRRQRRRLRPGRLHPLRAGEDRRPPPDRRRRRRRRPRAAARGARRPLRRAAAAADATSSTSSARASSSAGRARRR